MTTHLEKNSQDNESLKELMISFVSKSLVLTAAEEQSLIENSSELPKDSTLPDLIAHLQNKDLEVELVDKIKTFGREDAVL